MPKRRSRRRPRRMVAQSGGYLNTASKALAVAYAVKKLINVEFHTLNTNFTTDPSNAGAVVNLTAIAQGDTIASRQGNKIRVKYLECRGLVTLNASAADSQVRMMVVRDNNGSTSIPAITDLYADIATFRLNKPKLGDPQSNSRFSILMDKYIIVDAGHGLSQTFKFSTALDHHVFYTGSAATDEGKGHLYLFIASNEATNDPSVQAVAMVKWIDN